MVRELRGGGGYLEWGVVPYAPKQVLLVVGLIRRVPVANHLAPVVHDAAGDVWGLWFFCVQGGRGEYSER